MCTLKEKGKETQEVVLCQLAVKQRHKYISELTHRNKVQMDRRSVSLSTKQKTTEMHV